MRTLRKLALASGVVLALACSDDDASGTAGAGAARDADSERAGSGSAAIGGGGSGASAAPRDASQPRDAGDRRDAATRDDAASSDAGTPAADAGRATRPHPLYPALDLDALPGPGGAASGAYRPPALPTTTRTVTVTSTGTQARNDLLAACQTAGTAVTVPDGAGRLGTLDFGNVRDCDVRLGAQVVADLVYVGHLPGPMVAPSQRVRIRGGQLGSIMVDPGSGDIVFDGVVVNNAVLPPAQRSGTAIYLLGDAQRFVDRFAFVNSIIRMVATVPDPSGASDGCAYLAGNAHNVFFANDNVVTAGNRNSWGFRIGGGDNFLIVDSTVRVSFHKLIRMNDGPVDYVYVKGGIWMRESTDASDGSRLNDAFAQLGDLGTDHVYIHDPQIHLLAPEPVSFGAWNGPGQRGKSWEARRIAWHARSQSVISDALLRARENDCAAEAVCDYGAGTHSYRYDANLSLPADPWRDLPDLADDDPDAQPIAP